MRKPLVRLVLVSLMFAATAMGSLLWPRVASAAACPPAYCPNVASACNSLSCGFSLQPNGTCTDSSGVTHNMYVAICPACHWAVACYL